jgi:hypothetical protein
MVTERVRAIRRFLYHLIILAGAVSCILVWAKIEPKDLRGWTLPLAFPHWPWLLAAIALFAIGLSSSGYSLYRSLSGAKNLSSPPSARELTPPEKLINEKTQLDNRIRGLSRFIKGEAYQKLSAEHRESLDRQLKHMAGYSKALGERTAVAEYTAVGSEVVQTKQTDLSPNDPCIRVEVTSVTDSNLHRTNSFLLHNDGNSTAYRVQVQDIDLSGTQAGKAVASFPAQEAIPAKLSKPVLPKIESNFPWNSDLVPFVKWKDESSPTPAKFSVSYYDSQNNEFRTTAELAYVPLVPEDYTDMMKQFHRRNVAEVLAERKERRAENVSEIEVRNHLFRKVERK